MLNFENTKIAFKLKSNLDLNKVFKGIASSSGNSFVHETESQVILNGSYNINFTMDLVEKDIGLFQNIASRLGVDLEIAPVILDIIKDGKEKFGDRAWSSMIVKRLEDRFNTSFRADGFPEELVDFEEKKTEIIMNPKQERIIAYLIQNQQKPELTKTFFELLKKLDLPDYKMLATHIINQDKIVLLEKTKMLKVIELFKKTLIKQKEIGENVYNGMQIDEVLQLL